MNFPLYIDASMLKDFECREFGRQRYLLNRDTLAPNIHYVYGTAIHKAVQSFWEGKTFELAMADAYEVTAAYPVALIKHNVYASNRWMEMVERLPDLVACYFDSVEQDVKQVATWKGETLLECEWSLPYCYVCGRPEVRTDKAGIFGHMLLGCGHNHEVTLCGRIDRVMRGPELPDIKTASEISSQGIPWKQGYQNGKMLEVQFGLYDWWLNYIGMAPKRVYLEVLLKGYKSKPSRYEVIELPYVVTDAYRERFRQQLRWKVTEIVSLFRDKQEQRPWPMSQQLCQTKYSECPFLGICLHGETPKTLENYTQREQHLEIMKNELVTIQGQNRSQ